MNVKTKRTEETRKKIIDLYNLKVKESEDQYGVNGVKKGVIQKRVAEELGYSQVLVRNVINGYYASGKTSYQRQKDEMEKLINEISELKKKIYTLVAEPGGMAAALITARYKSLVDSESLIWGPQRDKPDSDGNFTCKGILEQIKPK